MTILGSEQDSSPLPRIIWVASRPPVPPFSGITSKTLCGLDALSSMTDVDLVTFSDESSLGKTRSSLQTYWHSQPISIHLLPYKTPASGLRTLKARRFQMTSMFNDCKLAEKLNELNWSASNQLLVFDDITLAPIGQEYGMNAILSPHDCMSQMFYSHFRALRLSADKLKKYIQYRLARYYEKEFYHSFLLVHAITHRDRVFMEEINPAARYHVVPNADLLNPGLVKDFNAPIDILIWGDLRIPACVKGSIALLSQIQNNQNSRNFNIVLIGKVPPDEAWRILGEDLLVDITYSQRLEDKSGTIRSAKIFIIPDIGGAGIKNRVVNVISSGLCLACLIPQMEGLDAITDRGAINAATMDDLVKKIFSALITGYYKQIAQLGEAIYQEKYSLSKNRELWREMVERANIIKNTAISDYGIKNVIVSK